MGHLACADAESQRAESAMGAGVAIATDDGHAGLGQALLRADHVHDALSIAAQRVERDAELLAVAGQLIKLGGGLRISHRDQAVCAPGRGRGAVIHGRQSTIRAAHAKASLAQGGERLRRGHFMDKMQVNVQRGRHIVLLWRDKVRRPDFVEQGAGITGHQSLSSTGYAL